MINDKMYVKPIGPPFPFLPVPGAQKNRMIGPDGSWVPIDGYYCRGIRNGELKIAPAPEPEVVAAEAAPAPPSALRPKRAKKSKTKATRGTK